MAIRRVFAPLVLLTLVSATGGHAQMRVAPATQSAKSGSPLWGDLNAGPYSVGFRILFRFDTSRTWHDTRNYQGGFSPDLSGRPVQINVWYPAVASSGARNLTFGDYVDQHAPKAFSELNAIMAARNRRNAADSVPRNQLAELLATPLRAQASLPAPKYSFPVVLYFGGLDAEINSNVVLAEYLASQGYIVASVSLLGPSNEQTFQSRTADDIEAAERDMEFAWAILSESPNTDRTRLAVMGHSVGGIEAVLFGMRNANVSAVISLDGTFAFQGATTVLTSSYGYSSGKMQAALLDLRRAQGAQGNNPLDLSSLESFRYSDRTFVTMKRMHHSDFTSFAVAGEIFHAPITGTYPLNGWSRATAMSGYLHVCRIIEAFLDAKVRGKSRSMADLAEMVQRADGDMKHEEATTLPPSPLEAAALVSQQGLAAATALFNRICGEQNVGVCVNSDRFNMWGYNLLGQNRHRDALAVFELAAWAHPTSANAQDSLVDGYLAVGEIENARKAARQAIDLTPADPLIDGGSKASFIADETVRLRELK